MWTDVTALASGLYVDWSYGFSFRVIRMWTDVTTLAIPNRDILLCFCYSLFQWRYRQFKICNTNRQNTIMIDRRPRNISLVICQINYFIWNEVLYLLIAPIDQQFTYLSLYPTNVEMSASEIWLFLPNLPMFYLIVLYCLWSAVLRSICNRWSAEWQISLLSGTFSPVAPNYLSSVSFKT